ncbi:MAG TPA: biotin transporter BioY [Gemmatimonadota bacterium]|nr:biotin transporter BioY [Gemmatimonadota bacterium]
MSSRALSLPFPASAPALERPAARALAILAFALLTALGAAIRIPLPFTPVPITLQTFFVMAAGIYLGPRDAAASQLGYLAMGAAGLPVFAGGAGFGHLFGATGGYLLSFPLAAALVGASVRPGDRAGRALAAFLAAQVVIFGFGTAWLAAFLGIGFDRALALGVIPFLPGGAVKVAAALGLAVRAR